MTDTTAIVPAAGLGRRMGADKALVGLAGSTLVERVVAELHAAGIEDVIVVRRQDADDLPAGLAVRTVRVSGEGDMADSLRAAADQLDEACRTVVICPVDHALVRAETFAGVATLVRDGAADVTVPVYEGRPGHPVAMRREVFEEIRKPDATLRDVIRSRPDRVRALPSANRWIHADLDRPEDLQAAQQALQGEPDPVLSLMRNHRSRRAYREDPLQEGQIERLVDAARFASTSSMIQAYSVVIVRQQERRAQLMALCGNQAHIGQAPVFAAICADLHKIAAACTESGQALQSQSLELFLQSVVDAALFGQNLALAAEAEGLGICMIGGARNHPLQVAELLELPRHVFVLFGMTIGHPKDDPVPRGRMPIEGVLHFERYDAERTVNVLRGADESMRTWARRANAEQGGYLGRPVNETKGWSDRMARSWGSMTGYVAARAVLNEELARLGFEL